MKVRANRAPGQSRGGKRIRAGCLIGAALACSGLVLSLASTPAVAASSTLSSASAGSTASSSASASGAASSTTTSSSTTAAAAPSASLQNPTNAPSYEISVRGSYLTVRHGAGVWIDGGYRPAPQIYIGVFGAFDATNDPARVHDQLFNREFDSKSATRFGLLLEGVLLLPQWPIPSFIRGGVSAGMSAWSTQFDGASATIIRREFGAQVTVGYMTSDGRVGIGVFLASILTQPLSIRRGSQSFALNDETFTDLLVGIRIPIDFVAPYL